MKGLDFPVIIINYLLYAIVSGFIGILFFTYLPFTGKKKTPYVKTKKSFLSIVGITLIFILSISNIFFFRESNINSLRQQAYISGFKKIDNLIAREDYISAFNVAKGYYEKIKNDSLILDKLNQTSLEVEIRSNPTNAKAFYKDIDSDEWSYIGDTPVVARIPGLNSQARGFIDFKIQKDGFLDLTSLTTAGLISRVSSNKKKNYFELTPLSEAEK